MGYILDRVKAQLPGPSLVLCLMLIVVLGTWLGISGPIDLSRLSALKEWQTILAACVALLAAAIAYTAAMARVKLDRAIAERQILSHKLSVYLRLEFALRKLAANARHIEAALKPTMFDKTVTANQIQLIEPPEIAEAWGALEIMPPTTIAGLRIIRVTLDTWKTHLEGHDPKIEWNLNVGSGRSDNTTWELRKLAMDVYEPCEAVTDQLASEIKAINDRLTDA